MSLPFYTYPGDRKRRIAGLPAQRQFPDSAAAWAATFPTLPTPVGLWTFQESASPIADKVGANPLIENQALLYAQSDTWPRDNPRRAIQLDTSDANEFAAAASTSHADIGALQSRSLLVRCRIPVVAAITAIMGAGSVTAGQRWGIDTDSTGRLRARTRDGAAVVPIATTVSQYDDNLYHDVVFALDRAGALLHIITETEDVTAALGATAAIDVDTGLRFGAHSGFSTTAGTRVSYAAMFNDYFTAAHLATFRTPR